jgi:uncharacterized protein YjbJ (UPF0337 family)
LQDPSSPRPVKDSHLGRGQVALLVALLAILILTVVWAAAVWTQSGDVAMGWHGWIALGLGTFFSLIIGCGLMALMFFSSRSGHDDAATPKLLRDDTGLNPANETVADPRDDPAGSTKQVIAEITGDGDLAEEGKRQQKERRAREEADARGPFETLNHLT